MWTQKLGPVGYGVWHWRCGNSLQLQFLAQPVLRQPIHPSPADNMAVMGAEMDFERADAGASQTYQQQAGAIKRGSYVMLKGHPCSLAVGERCLIVFFLPGDLTARVNVGPGSC